MKLSIVFSVITALAVFICTSPPGIKLADSHQVEIASPLNYAPDTSPPAAMAFAPLPLPTDIVYVQDTSASSGSLASRVCASPPPGVGPIVSAGGQSSPAEYTYYVYCESPPGNNPVVSTNYNLHYDSSGSAAASMAIDNTSPIYHL